LTLPQAEIERIAFSDASADPVRPGVRRLLKGTTSGGSSTSSSKTSSSGRTTSSSSSGSSGRSYYGRGRGGSTSRYGAALVTTRSVRGYRYRRGERVVETEAVAQVAFEGAYDPLFRPDTSKARTAPDYLDTSTCTDMGTGCERELVASVQRNEYFGGENGDAGITFSVAGLSKGVVLEVDVSGLVWGDSALAPFTAADGRTYAALGPEFFVVFATDDKPPQSRRASIFVTLGMVLIISGSVLFVASRFCCRSSTTHPSGPAGGNLGPPVPCDSNGYPINQMQQMQQMHQPLPHGVTPVDASNMPPPPMWNPQAALYAGQHPGAPPVKGAAMFPQGPMQGQQQQQQQQQQMQGWGAGASGALPPPPPGWQPQQQNFTQQQQQPGFAPHQPGFAPHQAHQQNFPQQQRGPYA
jgi:hypothetical protein